MRSQNTLPKVQIKYSRHRKVKRVFVDNIIPSSALYYYVPKNLYKKESALMHKNMRMFSPVTRTFLTAVVVLGLFIRIHPFGNTSSYFNDTELSTGNKLTAGAVFFNIQPIISTDSKSLRAVPTEGEVSTTEEPERPDVGKTSFDLSLVSGSSLPVGFMLEGELNSDNPKGCDGLNLDFNWGDVKYSGLFSALAPTHISADGTGHFNASIPDSDKLEGGAICQGNIVFKLFLENEKDGEKKTYTDLKKYSFAVQNEKREVITTDDSPAIDQTLPKNEEPKDEPKEEPKENLGNPKEESNPKDNPKEEPKEEVRGAITRDKEESKKEDSAPKEETPVVESSPAPSEAPAL